MEGCRPVRNRTRKLSWLIFIGSLVTFSGLVDGEGSSFNLFSFGDSETDTDVPVPLASAFRGALSWLSPEETAAETDKEGAEIPNAIWKEGDLLEFEPSEEEQTTGEDETVASETIRRLQRDSCYPGHTTERDGTFLCSCPYGYVTLPDSCTPRLPRLEVGQASVSGDWGTVNLQSEFRHLPVVLVGNPFQDPAGVSSEALTSSSVGDGAGVSSVRVNFIRKRGTRPEFECLGEYCFDLQVVTPDCTAGGGVQAAEGGGLVDWIAIDPGIFRDESGLLLQAGRQRYDGGGMMALKFYVPFASGSNPLVFIQPNTIREKNAVVHVATRRRMQEAFEVEFELRDSNGETLRSREEVAWLAVEQGRGDLRGGKWTAMQLDLWTETAEVKSQEGGGGTRLLNVTLGGEGASAPHVFTSLLEWEAETETDGDAGTLPPFPALKTLSAPEGGSVELQMSPAVCPVTAVNSNETASPQGVVSSSRVSLEVWSLHVNECQSGTHSCHESAVCVPLAGEETGDRGGGEWENQGGRMSGYSCECQAGFRGDGMFCENINECVEGTVEIPANSTADRRSLEIALCGSHAECVDVVPSASAPPFMCVCQSGYRNKTEAGRALPVLCEDINECLEENNGWCPENANCINREGLRNLCECKEGFAYSNRSEENEPGDFCLDVDECSPDYPNPPCESGTTKCTSIPGSYQCACLEGYEFASLGGGVYRCRDVNECDQNAQSRLEIDPNIPELCDSSANFECRNEPGSFFCPCKNGYSPRSEIRRRRKRTVPELRQPASPEGNSSSVSSNSTTFEGPTPSPFPPADTSSSAPTAESGSDPSPQPFSERAPAPSPAPAVVSTVEEEEDGGDVMGGSEEGNGRRRRRMQHQEGGDSDDGLVSSAESVAVSGVDADEIPPAPDLTGGSSNVTEEEDPSAAFQGNVTVEEEDGSGEMEEEGEWEEYEYEFCENVDECVWSPELCAGLGACTDTDGSFVCECEMGYRYNQTDGSCQDVDECAGATLVGVRAVNGSEVCGSEATCENADGSFLCSCGTDGFSEYDSLEGTCVDVDECLEGRHNCSPPAVCSNLDKEGWRCECPPEFRTSADGSSCENINECLEDPPVCVDPAARCVDRDPARDRIPFECLCDRGPGYRFYDRAEKVCVDMNECETPGEHDCECNQVCENRSLRKDGIPFTCRNYCAEREEAGSGCHPNALCTNVQPWGAARESDCLVLDEAGAACKNEAVTLEGTGTFGAVQCRCRCGYRGKGTECSPVDPWLRLSVPVSVNGKTVTSSDGQVVPLDVQAQTLTLGDSFESVVKVSCPEETGVGVPLGVCSDTGLVRAREEGKEFSEVSQQGASFSWTITPSLPSFASFDADRGVITGTLGIADGEMDGVVSYTVEVFVNARESPDPIRAGVASFSVRWLVDRPSVFFYRNTMPADAPQVTVASDLWLPPLARQPLLMELRPTGGFLVEGGEGGLPAGIVLNRTSGDLYGNPPVIVSRDSSETTDITVKAINAAGNRSLDLSLTVGPLSKLTVDPSITTPIVNLQLDLLLSPLFYTPQHAVVVLGPEGLPEAELFCWVWGNLQTHANALFEAAQVLVGGQNGTAERSNAGDGSSAMQPPLLLATPESLRKCRQADEAPEPSPSPNAASNLLNGAAGAASPSLPPGGSRPLNDWLQFLCFASVVVPKRTDILAVPLSEQRKSFNLSLNPVKDCRIPPESGLFRGKSVRYKAMAVSTLLAEEEVVKLVGALQQQQSSVHSLSSSQKQVADRAKDKNGDALRSLSVLNGGGWGWSPSPFVHGSIHGVPGAEGSGTPPLPDILEYLQLAKKGPATVVHMSTGVGFSWQLGSLLESSRQEREKGVRMTIHVVLQERREEIEGLGGWGGVPIPVPSPPGGLPGGIPSGTLQIEGGPGGISVVARPSSSPTLRALNVQQPPVAAASVSSSSPSAASSTERECKLQLLEIRRGIANITGTSENRIEVQPPTQTDCPVHSWAGVDYTLTFYPPPPASRAVYDPTASDLAAELLRVLDLEADRSVSIPATDPRQSLGLSVPRIRGTEDAIQEAVFRCSDGSMRTDSDLCPKPTAAPTQQPPTPAQSDETTSGSTPTPSPPTQSPGSRDPTETTTQPAAPAAAPKEDNPWYFTEWFWAMVSSFTGIFALGGGSYCIRYVCRKPKKANSLRRMKRSNKIAGSKSMHSQDLRSESGDDSDDSRSETERSEGNGEGDRDKAAEGENGGEGNAKKSSAENSRRNASSSSALSRQGSYPMHPHAHHPGGGTFHYGPMGPYFVPHHPGHPPGMMQHAATMHIPAHPSLAHFPPAPPHAQSGPAGSIVLYDYTTGTTRTVGPNDSVWGGDGGGADLAGARRTQSLEWEGIGLDTQASIPPGARGPPPAPISAAPPASCSSGGSADHPPPRSASGARRVSGGTLQGADAAGSTQGSSPPARPADRDQEPPESSPLRGPKAPRPPILDQEKEHEEVSETQETGGGGKGKEGSGGLWSWLGFGSTTAAAAAAAAAPMSRGGGGKEASGEKKTSGRDHPVRKKSSPQKDKIRGGQSESSDARPGHVPRPSAPSSAAVTTQRGNSGHQWQSQGSGGFGGHQLTHAARSDSSPQSLIDELAEDLGGTNSHGVTMPIQMETRFRKRGPSGAPGIPGPPGPPQHEDSKGDDMNLTKEESGVNLVKADSADASAGTGRPPAGVFMQRGRTGSDQALHQHWDRPPGSVSNPGPPPLPPGYGMSSCNCASCVAAFYAHAQSAAGVPPWALHSSGHSGAMPLHHQPHTMRPPQRMQEVTSHQSSRPESPLVGSGTGEEKGSCLHELEGEGGEESFEGTLGGESEGEGEAVPLSPQLGGGVGGDGKGGGGMTRPHALSREPS